MAGEKQKLVPKKQELKQFVFLFEIIPNDFERHIS